MLPLEKIKLLGTTKKRVTKGKNGKNVPRLEITEILLIQWNPITNDYQHESRVL